MGNIIKVDTTKLREAANRLSRLRADAGYLYDILNGSTYSSHPDDTSELYSALNWNDLTKLDSIVSALQYVADEFELAEDDIGKYKCGLDSSEEIYFNDDISVETTKKLFEITKKTTYTGKISSNGNEKYGYIENINSIKIKQGKYKNKIKESGDQREYHYDASKANDKNYKGKYIEQKKGEKRQEFEDSNPWDKNKATVAEVEASFSHEKDLINLKAEKKGKYSSGSAGVKVCKAEVSGSVSGGMYVYELNENGEKVKKFRPGVNAEISTSVSLFEANAEGKLGGDNFNVHGSADLKVASAEGTASVALTPNDVHIKAAAEANLVKLEGKAGVTVLGADVDLKGSVKVGIGAHADVGYHNGKLKFDIGAAVGIGFDLGFEVDCSGVVNSVIDVSKSIFNWAKKFKKKDGGGGFR